MYCHTLSLRDARPSACSCRRHSHRVGMGGGKLSSVSVSPDGPVTDAGRNLIFSSTSTLRSCGHAAVVPPALLQRRRRCATRVKNVLARHPAYDEPFRLAVVVLVPAGRRLARRSEEHTSELQSLMRIS